MVVSGAPKRNGQRHIVEIANMALDLLVMIELFKVKGRTDVNLQLRSGIHTGPCAAGNTHISITLLVQIL